MALGLPSVLPNPQPAIGELIRDRQPTFSFEFFPPKTEQGERLLWQAIRELESLRPSFVSITYGAGGSTRDTTVAVTERIATETTLLPMAHLTAVNHSVAELRHVIGRLAGVGVRNVLAVRGDPPGDPGGDWVRHPEGVLYAEDLVRLVRDAGDFSVGVAAFPYKHPRSSDVAGDTAHFVRKCRAGADFAITQMFFDADDYLRLRDRVAAAGCTTPILAGVMPVTQIGTIERSVQLSGRPSRRPWPSGSRRSPTTRRRCAGSVSSRPARCAGGCSTRACRGSTSSPSTAPPPPARSGRTSRPARGCDPGAATPERRCDGCSVVGTQLNWDDYATAWARLHGGFDPRAATPVVRAWLRFSYHLGFVLGRLRVGPTPVTVVGVLLCACVPLFAVRPQDGPFLAALFVLLAAVADSVDGAVAVATNRTTRLGYVYDSLADRLGEVAWLAAFWLVGAPGRSS